MIDGKFKTFMGVDIYVTERGRFRAQVGRKWVEKGSLTALEAEIAEQRSPVKVIAFSGWSAAAPHLCDVVKRHANGNFIGTDKRQITDRVYRFDQKVWDEMQEITAEIERLTAQRRQLVSRLTEFDGDMFSAAKGVDRD